MVRGHSSQEVLRLPFFPFSWHDSSQVLGTFFKEVHLSPRMPTVSHLDLHTGLDSHAEEDADFGINVIHSKARTF